jgi:hypothetical protein
MAPAHRRTWPAARRAAAAPYRRCNPRRPPSRATSAATFNGAFAPTSALTRRRSATNPSRSTFSANRIAGTRPARDTRFGSSNLADVFNAACNNCTYEMPFVPVNLEPSTSPIFPVRKGILRQRPALAPARHRWIQAEVRTSAVETHWHSQAPHLRRPGTAPG